MALTQVDDLPALTWKEVFHVGHPERREHSPLSHEGPGLSASRHPGAWRRIARLSGSTCALRRIDGADGRFVDLLSCPEGLRAILTRHAHEQGLLTPVTAYRVRWRDDEHDRTVSFLFPDREAAEREAEGRGCVAPVDIWGATDPLEARWLRYFQRPLPLGWAKEMAHLALLARDDRWDGAWWNEALDPARLSAPRGVIFPERLGRWRHRFVRSSPDFRAGAQRR